MRWDVLTRQITLSLKHSLGYQIQERIKIEFVLVSRTDINFGWFHAPLGELSWLSRISRVIFNDVIKNLSQRIFSQYLQSCSDLRFYLVLKLHLDTAYCQISELQLLTTCKSFCTLI